MSKDFEQKLKKMAAENHENATQLSYGSPTSTWSSKLILGGFVVLMSTTRPPSMSFQLHLEVDEQELDFTSFCVQYFQIFIENLGQSSI